MTKPIMTSTGFSFGMRTLGHHRLPEAVMSPDIGASLDMGDIIQAYMPKQMPKKPPTRMKVGAPAKNTKSKDLDFITFV